MFHFELLAGVLLLGAIASFVLCLGNFVAALVGWRGPHRGERLRKSAMFFLAVPLLVGAQRLVFSLADGGGDGQQFAELGHEAPTFALKDTNGETFDLAKHRGQVVLLNFFATWCGPCRRELPHLQTLWEKYGSDSRFALLVVDSGESDRTCAVYRSKGRYTLPMAADPDGSVSSLYETGSIPRTYLIGPDGRVVHVSPGFSTESFSRLEEELTKQLSLTAARPEAESQ